MNAFGKITQPTTPPVHNWDSLSVLPIKKYKCAYCDTDVSSTVGYQSPGGGIGKLLAYIYICPCGYPTYFDYTKGQMPLNKFGSKVEHLPPSIDNLYEESRTCYSVKAFTSAVLSCRKILMNIAVEKGAHGNLGFVDYVNYLDKNNFITAESKKYIDRIRTLGNEATHEIAEKNEDDAKLGIYFTEILLRSLYEAPEKLRSS